MRSDVRKAVTGASIGNTVEWFDFAVYGFLATCIAASFFPAGDETAGLRRQDRPPESARTGHPAHGLLDGGHRTAADVRGDRRRRPAAPSPSAMPAGLLRRRVV